MRDTIVNMFYRIDSVMDVLAQVMDSVGLASALSARVEVASPWALQYGKETGHRAGFHIVIDGSCLVIADGGAELALAAGDLVLLPHGTAHRIASHRTARPVDVHELTAGIAPGASVAIPGGSGDERCSLLCGSYSFGPEGASPLLRGLPELVHVPAGRSTTLDAAASMLASESRALGPGTAFVIDRLVDLLFVLGLRAWLDCQRHESLESWFGALVDPMVGPALQAMHADPGLPWTVELLAERVHLSRAAFARRFSLAVGEPPLTYLTRWRMTVAAQLLSGGEQVKGVASRVGYQNEFAFAKAFKRVRGLPPGQYRVREDHRLRQQTP